MPSTQAEKNGTWTGRARVAGVPGESKGGFRTKTEAKLWASDKEHEMRGRHKPRGKGPEQTTVAQALLDDAKESLPFKKAAVEDANRINQYLRQAGLPTLKVVERTKCSSDEGTEDGKGALFVVTEVPPAAERKIVPSLKANREKLEKGSVESTRIRRVLANMYVADLTVADLQDLVRARLFEGNSASTVRHDIDPIRSMLRRVRKSWNWKSVEPIANDDLDLPALPPGRTTVLEPEQEKALLAALETSYKPKAIAAIAILMQTAMRFTEAMLTARWGDIDWKTQLLDLSEAKAGPRTVPLNDAAMLILHAMERGADDEPIFGVTYDSLKKIFSRACERAGIEGLGLHDLRHTAATRAAKQLNGNVFLLKLITGHKSLKQLETYVNLKPQDAVEAYKETDAKALASPIAVAAANGVKSEKTLRREAQLRAAVKKDGAQVIPLFGSSSAKGPLPGRLAMTWSMPASQAAAPTFTMKIEREA